ncbi:MFS transporter [Actinomadura sp. NPDC048394]|uniref:MFS transporter n=1 Tax=Actinomadura sp. NPDC048394 TaxID=3158223 RepID=UPI0033DCDC4E
MSTSPPTDAAIPAESGAATGRLDGASRVRIFSVLAVIVLFTEVAPLQYTMISAALRQIAPAFPTVGANLNWAIIIFGLIGAAASPLIGKMSDIWGKKRMFLVCGMLFMAGCAICAVTGSWTWFLIGRGLQAMAIATAVIAYGLIRDLLPRRYVPIGIGVASTGLGFSALLAPIVGGWMVDNFSWRAIFWFLFGYTAVLFPLVLAVVPESRLRVRERLDVVGAVLLAGGAGLVLLYLDKGQDWGWGRPSAWGWAVAGLALVVLFVVIESRSRQPIMDLRLLFAPRVSMVLFVALFASFAIGFQNYAMGYMTQSPDAETLKSTIVQSTLQSVQQKTGQPLPASAVQVALDPGYSYGNGFSLLEYAWHIAIWNAVLGMVFGALAGIWARRSGPRRPLLLAAAVMAACGVTYAFLPHTWVVFTLVSAAFGIGFGAYYASTPNLIIEAVPQEQQGVSAGMLGIMQSMGVAIGLAVATAFLNADPVKASVSVGGRPPVVQEIPQVFADRGYEIGFLFAAGASLIALIGALIMRHGRAPATGGTAH